MTPETGGRGCAKCQHHVPDLSAANDEELYAILSGGDAPKCARFRPDQLDRVVLPRWSDPVVALQLLALCAAAPALAKDVETGSVWVPIVSGDESGVHDGSVRFVYGNWTTIASGPGTSCSPMIAQFLKPEYEVFGLIRAVPEEPIQLPSSVPVESIPALQEEFFPKEEPGPKEPEKDDKRLTQPAALTERRRLGVGAFAELFRSWFGGLV